MQDIIGEHHVGVDKLDEEDILDLELELEPETDDIIDIDTANIVDIDLDLNEEEDVVADGMYIPDLRLDNEIDDVDTPEIEYLTEINEATTGLIEGAEESSELTLLERSRAVAKIEDSVKVIESTLSKSIRDFELYINTSTPKSSELRNIERALQRYMMVEKPSKIPADSLFMIHKSLQSNLDTNELIKFCGLEKIVVSEVDKIEFDSYIKKVKRFMVELDYTIRKETSQNNIRSKKLIKKHFRESETLMKIINDYPLKAFTKEIILSKSQIRYVCGNCSEENESKDIFFEVILLPYDKASKQLALNPKGHICSKCQALNVLTSLEYKQLQKALDKNYRRNASDFLGKCSTFHKGINLTKYVPSFAFLMETLPTVYRLDAEPVQAKIVEEEVIDISGALLRYRQNLKRFRSVIKSDEVSPEVNRDLLVKILCSLNGREYSVTKRNAINSLITYIYENTVLYTILSNKSVTLDEALLVTEDLLKVPFHLEPYEVDKICYRLSNQLNVEYKPVVDEEKKLISENLTFMQELLLKELAKVREGITKKKLLREDVITELLDNAEAYSYVSVANIESLDVGVMESLSDSPRLMDFINYVSDLMILNTLAEGTSDFWLSNMAGSCTTHFKNLQIDTRRPLEHDKSLNNFLSCLDKNWKESKHFMECPRGKNFTHSFIEYSVRKGVEFDSLFILLKLKESLSNLDYFTFCSDVLKAGFITSETYDLPAYRPIREFIRNHTKEAQEFVDTHGTDAHDRLRYLTGNQFTLEELKRSVKSLRFEPPKDKIIKRKDNESVDEYISRVANYKKEDKVELLQTNPLEWLENIGRYVPAVLGCSNMYKYYLNDVSSINTFNVMHDFLFRSLDIHPKKLFYTLGINEALVNSLGNIDTVEPFVDITAIEKYYLDTFLCNTYYTDDDLTEITMEDAPMSTRINMLLMDRDLFEDNIEHLPKRVKELINEHYSS